MITRVQTKRSKEVSKGDDPAKRDALIEAARVLFTTRGYEATTIGEVARHAGVAVGTVYLYFKNKSDLLYAVKGDWDDAFLLFMAQPEIQALPHRERIRPFVEAGFNLCEQHTEMVQLMGMQREQVGEMYEHNGEKIEQALQVMFQEGIDAGVFRPVFPKAAASIAFGMVNQVLIHCFVNEVVDNKQPYIDALVDAFEQWLLKKPDESEAQVPKP